ncbi:lipopolysaccharide biosynthesis protein [Ulvibacterium sp.]|uniref:lipopolysaccharide biosynthesis protein n=1 Tax=Ulvibacterium sp. TaxID=2665914 RepID=UPI003CC5D45A
MKIKSQSLLVNFSGYTIINLLNSLTPFIILPILTRNLSKSDLGIIDIFTTSSLFLTPLIGLCLIQSLSKFYFSIKNRKAYLSTLFSSALIFSAGWLILVAVCLFSQNFIELPSKTRWLILCIIFYVCLNLIVEGFLLLKRNEENLRQFASVRLLKASLDIGLTIFLLLFIDDYFLRVLGITVSTAIAFLIVMYKLISKKAIVFEVKKEILKKIFVFSLPLILHTTFANILNYADRYFILEILGTATLGKYSVVYQLCMVISLIINSFNMAWAPYFMKNMTRDHAKFRLKMKSWFCYYTGFLVLFALILFILMPLIYKIYIGQGYEVNHWVYAGLLTAYFFNGMYRFKINYLFYYEDTKAIAKLSFIAALASLSLCYILIPRFGLIGAAISTLGSYFLLYALLEVQLLKKRPYEGTLKNN